MLDYEYQWQQILQDNIFTEEAIISNDETMYLTVKGCYFSGSVQEDALAPYSTKHTLDKDGFQLSPLELPDTIDARKDLNGCTLLLPGRNLRFKILSVSGNLGGVMTLNLLPKGEEETD